MQYTVIAAALLGAALALPQQRAVHTPGNPNTRILNFESFQDGANFGHQLFQEDGTTSGQKYGPDGLLYGFYSYIQESGNRVKVYWRAGAGVGYEVLGVEGLVAENLGSLKAAHPREEFQPPAAQPAPQPQRAPQAAPVRRAPQPSRPRPARVQNPNTFIPTAPTPRPTLATQPPRRKPAATLHPQNPIPVVPHTSTTPAPHRFDYPATLNLERTGTGFFSSLVAS